MTNLTHLSLAHTDQCPHHHLDTLLKPPAGHPLSENREAAKIGEGVTYRDSSVAPS